jgi:hypothetical protein
MKSQQAPPTLSSSEAGAWFAGRIPDGWFTGPPRVSLDNDEILVAGTLPDVDLGAGASDADRATARRSRIAGWREDTRDRRIQIAGEAQHRFRRKVSWAADCGGEEAAFTTLGLPVMTRLRMQDRAVLDTLIDAGVARSRSEALAWCVRLVGRHQSDWIQSLRDALTAVEQVRGQGPEA